jgi:hypothetical protein
MNLKIMRDLIHLFYHIIAGYLLVMLGENGVRNSEACESCCLVPLAISLAAYDVDHVCPKQQGSSSTTQVSPTSLVYVMRLQLIRETWETQGEKATAFQPKMIKSQSNQECQ